MDTCPNPLGRHLDKGFLNCACTVSDGPNQMNWVRIKNQRVFIIYTLHQQHGLHMRWWLDS